MSAQRTERLLNLVIALRATKRLKSKAQLRRDVPQYAESDSDEAFDRMFERDKDELRELGVPLVTGMISTAFEDEQGYRIDPDAYALPQISFTPTELAVLGLAARAWQQARLSGAAGRAMTKLRALGESPDDDAVVGVEPRVGTSEPAFLALYEATRDARAVTFTYRAASHGQAEKRRVDPWSLTSWHGHWYLIAFDRGRTGQRVFRLSRIEGRVVVDADTDPDRQAPPPDLDAGAVVSARFAGPSSLRARVDLAPGRGQLLRRDGEPVEDRPCVEGFEAWSISGRPASLAADIAALGPDAVVVDPDEVRREVVQLLTAARQAHTPSADDLAAVRTAPAAEPAPAAPASRPGRKPRKQQVVQGATEHLSRLLAEVPFLLERPGIPTQDAARHFGITEAQLVKDLELLFVCGLPGHLPDDLIEAEWESGRVYLRNADAIAQPLRLSIDEAISLLVGLRMLADAPGAGDRQALDGAIAKLTAASGEAASVAASVQVSVDTPPAEAELLTELRDAVRHHRRLRLRYLVPGRDEQTERDVDPIRVLAMGGRWYLEAWCHRAQAVRTFRLDRIDDAADTGLDGTPPRQAHARELGPDIFQPSADDVLVDLALLPQARWVVDYYQAQVLSDSADGLLVRVRTGDLGWVRQLALRLGGSATVLTPAGLRHDVAATAAAALAHYHATEGPASTS